MGRRCIVFRIAAAGLKQGLELRWYGTSANAELVGYVSMAMIYM